jgi:hypothetical protein
MKQIPGFMMRHKAFIEPYIGANSTGEVFGTTTPVTCHFVEKVKMVRNAQGEEVTSSSSYITAPTHNPPENSRVLTPYGLTRRVVAVERNTWPDMPIPANTIVYLD